MSAVKSNPSSEFPRYTGETDENSLPHGNFTI